MMRTATGGPCTAAFSDSPNVDTRICVVRFGAYAPGDDGPARPRSRATLYRSQSFVSVGQVRGASRFDVGGIANEVTRDLPGAA